jgi:hypothetical protein
MNGPNIVFASDQLASYTMVIGNSIGTHIGEML